MSKEVDSIANELNTLSRESRSRRLTAAEEQRGAALFRDLVLSGGKAVTLAIEKLPELPWFIPVTGTGEAWPQLSPSRRKSFVTALRAMGSEPGKRVRLSLARGLYKVDPDSAVKLLLSTLRLIGEPGTWTAKDRQAFASVLLGKNKPWLIQLDLKTLRPIDAQLLAVHAVSAIGGITNPPVALSILSWAKGTAGPASLPETSQAELAESFRRWSPRWLKELSAGEELPPKISEVVREKLQKSGAAKSPLTEPKPETSPGSPSGRRPSPKEHQPRKSVEAGELAPLLRGIERLFGDLKRELAESRERLQRQRLPEARTKLVARLPSPASDDEVRALREQNAMLTENIAQLRRTLNELAEERFTEAVSREADTNSPVSDPTAQFKSYLQAQLRDELAKHKTVNPDNRPHGVPLLLENIFHVLEENGIDLSNIAEPPSIARRRY